MSDIDHIKTLVLKVQQGEIKAFEQLVERYQHLAYTVAINIVKNNEEAEEVVQDAFVKAYRNIHQHNLGSKFSSWLYKIVYNTALTHVSKKRLETEPMDQGYDKDYGIENKMAWSGLLHEERNSYVQLALEELSDDDRLTLTLFYLAEKSVTEIGEITGWSKSAIKVRLHRARAKLHEQLDGILKTEKRSLL